MRSVLRSGPKPHPGRTRNVGALTPQGGCISRGRRQQRQPVECSRPQAIVRVILSRVLGSNYHQPSAVVDRDPEFLLRDRSVAAGLLLCVASFGCDFAE
ncbi:hypothetical protein GC163_16885 [bacterium]|nr:hypothetical protein [bacterium]